MMKHRKAANPLQLIALKQPIGKNDADDQLLPLLVHLDEVRTGNGMYDSMRIITVYLRAMLSSVNNTDTKKNDTLIRYMTDAGQSWIHSAEKCVDRGMSGRIVLSGDDWSVISRAVRIFIQTLPLVPVYIWKQSFENAMYQWNVYESSLSSQQH